MNTAPNGCIETGLLNGKFVYADRQLRYVVEPGAGRRGLTNKARLRIFGCNLRPWHDSAAGIGYGSVDGG